VVTGCQPNAKAVLDRAGREAQTAWPAPSSNQGLPHAQAWRRQAANRTQIYADSLSPFDIEIQSSSSNCGSIVGVDGHLIPTP
jgi:hypothetical protein